MARRESLDDQLALALRARRLQLGLGKREAAQRAGLHPATYHCWEAGVHRMPAVALRRALGALQLKMITRGNCLELVSVDAEYPLAVVLHAGDGDE